MISHIYVDGDENYLIRYPGSLREAARAIQDMAGSGLWAPGGTPEITREILRGLGNWEDESIVAPNDRSIDHGEPYWMIYAIDDMVYLGCGEPEFLTWSREYFAGMKLSEARCRRLVRYIRALSRLGLRG